MLPAWVRFAKMHPACVGSYVLDVLEVTEMIRAVMVILADYDPEVDHLGSTAGRIVRAVLQETVLLRT